MGGDADRELELLRRVAAAHRDRRREAGRNLRWPEGFKRRAVALLGQGLSACELSRALGISRQLMIGWRRRQGGEIVEGVGFTELGVVPAASRSCPSPTAPSSGGDIVLRGPCGAIVTGLGFRHIASLLQAGFL